MIHAQNAAVIACKHWNSTVFESFEVSPPAAEVMGAKGKLLCSYPGPAIAVPNATADNPAFLEELASFLSQMDVDILDSAATSQKAQTTVVEERDTAHPKYITELLTGILRGMGQPAEVLRIQKRIADDVLWKDTKKPWRRSPLWLVIRVAIQTTLYRETSSHLEYKAFMLFTMATLLQKILSLRLDFSSDLIFHIRAKISRRLYKLGDSAPKHVNHLVLDVVKAAEKVLQARWLSIQAKQSTSPRWTPQELDFRNDTNITFLHSKSYLSKVLGGAIMKQPSRPFKANHPPRLENIVDLEKYANEGLAKCFALDPSTALADFETSVRNHIDQWLDHNIHTQNSCSILASCIEQYATTALSFYNHNPEALSMMLLTIFELWVALDKVAVFHCPLMRDYPPQVPSGLLDPLLLRHATTLTRLTNIEKYLITRHRATDTSKSIFSDKADNDAFAVRYFKTSPQLQSLKQRIERDAKLTRERKLEELESQNDKYYKLIELAESMDHAYNTNRRGISYHWKKRCGRCHKESQARSMEILIHEWPLPEDSLKAAVAVFELACPRPFALWRATTYNILSIICMRPGKELLHAQPPMQLDSYPGLNGYISSKSSTTVTIASSTKSFQQSHYGVVPIPAEKSAVCLRNALQFRLYGKDTDTWAAEPIDCNVQHLCTLQLPENGPYKDLQFAVDATTHESNQTISKQYTCPTDLDLHEYLAFTSLRSGHRLQWMNITREIRSRLLSFHRQEVHTLITQAVWQAGNALPDGERECHLDLKDSEFCLVLLQELSDLLHTVNANWQEIATISTIIALAGRLLATNNDERVISTAYELLRTARGVSFGWAKILAEKMRGVEDEKNILELQLRICEIVGTCRGTFDVEPNHLPQLFNSAEDLSVAIQCAIQIHDTSPLTLSTVPEGLKRHLERHSRLSHSLERRTRHLIEVYPEGLNNAITALWTAFRPGSGWKPIRSPNERWITTMSAEGPKQQSQYIQLNLLSGQLLVNRDPLGRLPGDIVVHSTYKRIFGHVSTNI